MSKDYSSDHVDCPDSDFELFMNAWLQSTDANYQVQNQDEQLSFNSYPPHTRLPLLSQNRYDLLNILEVRGYASVHQLANLSGRQLLAIQADVDYLLNAGIITWVENNILSLIKMKG